jgi:hypothetical protein
VFPSFGIYDQDREKEIEIQAKEKGAISLPSSERIR